MSTTPLYDLETIEYNTTGWNGIVTANMQKMEAHLHSRFLVTLGESVAVRDAIYIKPEDGKAYKAQTTEAGDKQPALGLAVDVGDADEEIRVQRVGLVNFGSGLLPGERYYLSASAGQITPNIGIDVDEDPFTAVSGAFVDLSVGNIIPLSETVTSSDGATTYAKNIDYEINYANGRILARSDGAITDGESCLASYVVSSAEIHAQFMGYAVSSSQLFLDCGINDSSLLHSEGDEYVQGLKTFVKAPVLSTYTAPTTDTTLVTKKYVDDKSEAETDATSIAGIPVYGDDIGDGKVLQYNAELGRLEYEALPSGADAGAIKGVLVDDTAKANGYVLKYNAATGKIVYAPDEGGSSGTGITAAEAKKLAIIFG
jgi:hypothetical protein